MKKKYLAKLEITDSPRRHEANFTLDQVKAILEGIDYPAEVDIKVVKLEPIIERARKAEKNG